MAKDTSQQERLKKLLDKVNSLNIGGGGWLKVPTGTTTIRILPPVGSMEYFFIEIGQHYIGDSKQPYYCPAISTEGKEKCPICEVNEALYQAGEKDAASQFRATRAFLMNVVDRAHPDQGVLKYAPGTTVFGFIASAISDPDYGDISDPYEGYDLRIEREGEGKEKTKYTGRPVKRSTPLSGDENQMSDWIEAATDLREYVDQQLLPYDELAKKSGVDVYFAGSDEDEEPAPPKRKAAPAAPPKAAARPMQSKTIAGAPAKRVAEPEPDEDEDVEEDDGDEPPARKSASQAISDRMKERQQRAKLLRK